MSTTDTDKVMSYPLSEIPDFIKKEDMSVEELEYQCHKLRDENHQLQLRILGVNELARLLQDRNEVVGVLKERNKRLEVSLVRLENRCANFERQLKLQKSSGVASAKPGQSPFIPGPSKQILENLMQENIELKKTVNSLQKKGSSGYLEAVKTTQLEEFIEQQKAEIDQLRGQINNLTSGDDEVGGISNSSGGGLSLPATVTDHGPLKRQLIKMQKTMAVKDRFCTLLSQQVTELQRKLNRIQSESAEEKSGPQSEQDGVDLSSSATQENKPVTETDTSGGGEMDTKKDISFYQKQVEDLNSELKNNMAELNLQREEIKRLNTERDDFKEKFKTSADVYSTMLADNAELKERLERMTSTGAEGAGGGAGPSNGEVQRLKDQIVNLQKLLDGQVQQYTGELRSKDNELNSMRALLEEAQMKFMKTDSELVQLQHEIKQKQDEVLDLESENDTQKSINQELMRNITDLETDLKKYKASTGHSSHLPFSSIMPGSGYTPSQSGSMLPGMMSGGRDVPKLIGMGNSNRAEGLARDWAQGLTARGSTDTKKSTVPPPQQPMQPGGPVAPPPFSGSSSPQLPPHTKPGPLNLNHQPPNSNQRAKSPIGHPNRPPMHPQSQYPHGSLHNTPMTPVGSMGVGPPTGRPLMSKTSPSGSQQFGGQGLQFGGPGVYRSSTGTGSVGPMTTHMHYSSPQPLITSNPPITRMRPQGTTMPHPTSGYPSNQVGGGMRFGMSGTGNMPPTTMGGGPPPLPPRSAAYGNQYVGGAPMASQQPMFGRMPPQQHQFSRQSGADLVTSSFPPPGGLAGLMSSDYSGLRERSSTGGATSPAPLHRPSTPHDGSSGGVGGSNTPSGGGGNRSPSSMHPPYGGGNSGSSGGPGNNSNYH